MIDRFLFIPKSQSWIVRAQPNRLVKIFKALFKLPKVQVVKAQAAIAGHEGGVQGERAFVLGDRFVEAPMTAEHASPKGVSLA
jgi:hypothetical protein